MNRTQVASSNLRSVGYDAASATLEVQFKSGTIYQYFGVPEPVYLALMRAGSKGSYFSDYIKDTYRYIQIA